MGPMQRFGRLMWIGPPSRHGVFHVSGQDILGDFRLNGSTLSIKRKVDDVDAILREIRELVIVPN